MTVRSIETVVVGAGQAGLVMSWHLRDAGREHVLLDRRSSLGGGWQDRWDAFRFVSPNWIASMPGYPYAGSEPDGFMPRDELIAHFRGYAAAIEAPVELETDVTRLTALDGNGADRFELTTSRGQLRARSVVVAGGPFQRPNIPAAADGLAPSILSLHSHDYRNPDALPPGGVLLIGSGQSGVQLAEELMAAGRSVTMSVGRCGRVPRWYRGKDIFWWLRALGTRGAAVGTPLPTASTLPSPAARFACNPQLSGHGGGHETNLHRMAADGLRLVGRFEGVDGTRARFRGDLGENLAFADAFFPTRFRDQCDTFAERAGESLPPADPDDDFRLHVPEVTDLDLGAEGIATILWTSGYRPAFDWIELPVLDEFGLPVQAGAVPSVEGLTFIGTPWLVDMGSANLVGLTRDAEAIAAHW
ncbi:MAG TPA: NAD(P)-binding domain-containing protein [Candidatus Limnocylindrales bacterium]|nr:NAD(P)-binding domain-containing protein [Candidatus Limnocylindrales bacterium]